ncbi:MAG TPA: hypothetical protein VFV07_00045 [Rhizomicrobium sp.]|nr:hypothetical protein [Rhizomicrobium sp.]
MATRVKQDSDILSEFERNGCNALMDLVSRDPEAARLWLEQNLPRIQIVYKLFNPSSEEFRGGALSSRRDQRRAPEESAEHRFGKIRAGLMMDLSILEYVNKAPRAVSVDSVLAALHNGGFLTPDRRAALVTKLNRMKDKGFLKWYSGTRARDIKIGDTGIQYADELRKRLLTSVELNFVDRHAADDEQISKIISLKNTVR